MVGVVVGIRGKSGPMAGTLYRMTYPVIAEVAKLSNAPFVCQKGVDEGYTKLLEASSHECSIDFPSDHSQRVIVYKVQDREFLANLGLEYDPRAETSDTLHRSTP